MFLSPNMSQGIGSNLRCLRQQKRTCRLLATILASIRRPLCHLSSTRGISLYVFHCAKLDAVPDAIDPRAKTPMGARSWHADPSQPSLQVWNFCSENNTTRSLLAYLKSSTSHFCNLQVQ